MHRPLRHFWWCWAFLALTLLTRLPAALSEGEEPEPEFIGQIANVTVAQGRDAVLSCSVAHLNDYVVGWVKVETKAIQATGRKVVTLNTRVSVDNIPGSPTWKLIIRSAQPDDAGYYMAQVNSHPMKSQMAYLSVMEPPNIDDGATPSVMQVRENESVVLHCTASGQPVPNITWRREDGSNMTQDSCLPHTNDTRQQQEGLSPPRGYGRLCIASASRSSMGTYFCIASNGVLPSVSKRIQLDVLFPTVVKQENSLVGVHPGAAYVSLECSVEASPQTNHFFWYKSNYSIGVTDRYSMTVQKTNLYTVKMTLLIQDVQDEDIGLYRCQAGKAEASIRVYYVQTPSTPSTSTVEWSAATETTSRKQRPPRTSSAHPFIQSSMITTESSRWVTFYQHTSAEAGVRTSSSSNRPVQQDVTYKNLSFHRGHSSSLSTRSNLCLILYIFIYSIASSTQVLSHFPC